jgi:hypothetical protein
LRALSSPAAALVGAHSKKVLTPHRVVVEAGRPGREPATAVQGYCRRLGPVVFPRQVGRLG